MLQTIESPSIQWSAAVDAFLAGHELAPKTRRVYRGTLEAIGSALPATQLAAVTAEDLRDAITELHRRAAPATWNRQVATVRSLLAWCARQGWLAEDPTALLERHAVPTDHTRALPYAELDRLWRRESVALREKTLWRLLYETAARAEEVLYLNVEDLDLANKRARIVRKGGDVDTVHWQSGAAQLLPRLLGGRRRGPVFLADRPPLRTRPAAANDLCPTTGRARLSYRRAAELFKAASGGATLHQLRHSALTHLAEANVSLPLLMAKSRHASLRTMQRYARPGADAVARLTADHDPARRRQAGAT
jgi:integrase